MPRGWHAGKFEPIMIKPRFLIWKSDRAARRRRSREGNEVMSTATLPIGMLARPAARLSVAGIRGAGSLVERTLDPDSSLISRCLSGEETAWEELVRLHTRRVFGLCYRFTGRDSEAQDLTQEVFVRVFRTLRTFRAAEGSFATWLARVTRNLLIDHYRRTRQDRVTDSIEDQLPVLEEGVAAPARPDSALAGREASEILQAALQKLSPDLREAVILRDLQEMEYREIAAVLRIPEGTVKSRINRGRVELARVLKKQKLVV